MSDLTFFQVLFFVLALLVSFRVQGVGQQFFQGVSQQFLTSEVAKGRSTNFDKTNEILKFCQELLTDPLGSERNQKRQNEKQDLKECQI